MNDEKKSFYLYMTMGYAGLLLIGLASMRLVAVLDDSQGQAFVLFGFILVMVYIRFMEKKSGVSNKESMISKSIWAVVFSILSFWLYF